VLITLYNILRLIIKQFINKNHKEENTHPSFSAELSNSAFSFVGACQVIYEVGGHVFANKAVALERATHASLLLIYQSSLPQRMEMSRQQNRAVQSIFLPAPYLN
jgi:hypothetical protein